jgi:tetratricopeptide (TPR) repeat protein
MAFEKAKVLKAAEKFLSQGKINAAIKEYRQIIANDGDDLTTLNMLGDLLARAGEKEEAASCFLRIAEHFRDQGFTLKAIAMYRKIDKLQPRDPEIAMQLAELYSTQGLIADARAQYLIVADAYTRAGESKQTLDVLHRIADLDPHNTEIRLKLASGYLKEHMPAEAAKAYNDAAGRLYESGQFEKALEAYDRALELRPADRSALKGLVSTHVALGTADEAAELLEQAAADTPDDPELVSMLAQAYIDAEDAAGAERATAMLMKQDASNYRRYIEIARLYLKLGQEDEVARILASIIEPMLAGREESDLLELVNELLARDPEHVPSLRLLARIHWWQRDMDKLRSSLERLLEASEAAGLTEDERYALTQLVRLAPDEQRYMDRLDKLGGFLDEGIGGAGMMVDPSLAGMTSFETFPAEETTPQVPEQPAEMTSEFEWNTVSEESPAHGGVSFADLNEAEPQIERNTIAEPIPADSLSGQATADQIAVGGRSQADAEAMIRQELESVDFYITQGYSDIALDTLELLERQFGSNPEIEARREKLKAAALEAKAEVAQPAPRVEAEAPVEIGFGEIEFETGPVVTATPEPPAAVETPAQAGGGLDSGLAEIFEEFRMEAEGEGGASHEDFETHYNMATAYKEMDLLDEAIREFQIAAGLTGSADGTSRYFQCCNMLGHCFILKDMPRAAALWFKKGLDAPGRSPEEYKALQYELGSAYEAMGDLHRAVAAFTEVYGVDVGYRDIAEKLESLQAQAGSHKKKKKGK